MRRLIVSLLSVLLLAGQAFASALPAAASDGRTDRVRTDAELLAESIAHDLHNQARANPAAFGYSGSASAAPLTWWSDVLEITRDWSDQQAADGRMYHNPDVFKQLCCLRSAGENVAFITLNSLSDGDVEAATRRIFQAWMDSDGHRKNILGAKYDQGAVGISLVGRRCDGSGCSGWAMYLTGAFRQHNGETPPGFAYDTPPADSRVASFDSDRSPSSQPEAQEPDRPTPTARDIAATCDNADHTGFDDTRGTVHDANVRCIAAHGITQGKADGSYDPSGTLTHAQAATFLRRTLAAAGKDVPDSTDDTCRGTAGALEDHVEALIAAGIVRESACESASEPITRSLMARWVDRTVLAAGATVEDDTDWYADDEADANQDHINAITALGVVTGNGQGRFSPAAPLSRAQMATFLARALDVARSA